MGKEWAGIAQSVQRLATAWTVRRSNPVGREIFPTRPDRRWGPSSLLYNGYRAFPGGKVAGGVGLRPLACWDRGFESHWGHGCLSVVSVVCCQVGVSATDCSLVQGSPTDRGASLCVIKKPRTREGYSPLEGCRNTNPQWVVASVEKKLICVHSHVNDSQLFLLHIELTWGARWRSG